MLVGVLVVVKPRDKNSIAGIITERTCAYICIVPCTAVSKILVACRITVTTDTKVLIAMKLMTDNRIRHIPVIDDKDMIGMVSIGDFVRAVVSEYCQELNCMNAYIQGGY